MLRVFVVEDSPSILERLEAMLGSIPGVASVGHASGADEAIRAILTARPDAVVLDLRLAQGSGFDVLRYVLGRTPSIDFYVLSNVPAEPYRRLTACLGARGFFDKTFEFDRLRDTLTERAARTLN
jgi:DNA-binding NarL/FixJ family response regulator